MYIPEIDLKNQKKFLVLKIIAFQSGSTNSLNLEKDTCHWQSMCYETSLKFDISLRETFFMSGSIRVMVKYDESALIQILLGFGTLQHVECERVFQNGVS